MDEDIVFEKGGRYFNLLGWYEVLEIKGDRLSVRYEKDGREDILSAETQKGIMVGVIRNITREKREVGPIAESRDKFFFYVNECNKHYRFGHDLRLYREIIQMHREKGELNLLLNDEEFCTLIFETLKAWNMNQRGARLNSFVDFRNSILEEREGLVKLYKIQLFSLNTDTINREVFTLLERVFCNLRVMQSKRRIVGVSKTLHFLLPDLVIPIDGTYTMTYFYLTNKPLPDIESEVRTFKDIFMRAFKIVRKLNLKPEDVNKEGWNTSVPKLIDNAIIGLFKHLEKGEAEI